MWSQTIYGCTQINNETFMRSLPCGRKTKQTKKKIRNELERSWSIGDALPSNYPPSRLGLLYHVSPQWENGSLVVNDVEKLPKCYCRGYRWTREHATFPLLNNKEPGQSQKNVGFPVWVSKVNYEFCVFFIFEFVVYGWKCLHYNLMNG